MCAVVTHEGGQVMYVPMAYFVLTEAMFSKKISITMPRGRL